MLPTLLDEMPLCAVLMKKVEDYFQDEKHKKQFEKWYREKYGKNYEWK